ncbi:DUF5592 family protein [Turicibacter bilis]|uniref:DUF5592 family protein n=1 Tax=Turicibacter bilis TaxID=2735723 RepID=UPI001BAEA484|nr:DUF5592 family protein [Turicibacter bilis]MBS3198976.1 hypothetical protein [Turicibacter bilis]
MYIIPKETKVETRLVKMFSTQDLMFACSWGLMAYFLSFYVYQSPLILWSYSIFNVIIVGFLITPVPNSPKMKRWQSIYFWLIRNRNFYHRMLSNSDDVKNHVLSTQDIMEITGRTEFGFFKNRSGEVFDLVKIQGMRGIKELPIEEIEFHNEKFSRAYRHVKNAVTFICMDCVVDFSEQIDYYQYRLEKFSENEMQRAWLQYEIDKLTSYQGFVTEERYYALIFATNDQELLTSKQYLNRIESLNLCELNEDEKRQLLFKLHNLNTDNGV